MAKRNINVIPIDAKTLGGIALDRIYIDRRGVIYLNSDDEFDINKIPANYSGTYMIQFQGWWGMAIVFSSSFYGNTAIMYLIRKGGVPDIEIYLCVDPASATNWRLHSIIPYHTNVTQNLLNMQLTDNQAQMGGV